VKDFTIKKRFLSKEEIKEVANIHHEYLNTSFLSQLGAGFLFYLYASINECNETELIIAKSDRHVIGFVTGAESLKPIYTYLLKKYFFQASFKLIPHLFNLSKLKKITEVLLYSKNEVQLSDTKHHPKAELLSIAVKKEYRGSGAAQELFHQLAAQFMLKGHSDFKIIVGSELEAAKRFYTKMGAKKIDKIHIHKEEESFILKVRIDSV